MIEIKYYKSSLTAVNYTFFNLGPTCPGPSVKVADMPRANLAKGRIVQLPILQWWNRGIR